MSRVLHDLLRDATRTVLGDQNRGRAAIFFPYSESTGEDFLIVIARHRLSKKSASRTKFYIGKDENKDEERGTAGITYLGKQISIAHIIQKKGYWECDNTNFINFDESRSQLPYRTFVNVPIIGLPLGNNTDCLGVLCMDSQIPNAFDSKRAKLLLEAIASRVATALTIYMELLRELNYPAPYFEKVFVDSA